MDYKKLLKEKEDQNVFIKTSTRVPVDGKQKAALNRRGNELFNSGDIESARRIFMTTSYSDGLSRIGDHYKSKGRMLEALRMYWIAPDRNKAESIIMQLALIIQSMLKEGENNDGH